VCISKQSAPRLFPEARTGACIYSRCEPIFVTSARWPLTAGPSGLWSSWERGNAISVAPLWPSSSKQTYSLRKESRCPSVKSMPMASSSDYGTELFRFVGCAGVFRRRVEVSSLAMSSGSWPSPASRRELREPGRRFGPALSDVSLTLLRSRALAGKGRGRMVSVVVSSLTPVNELPDPLPCAPATSSVVNYLVDPASSHMLVSKIKPCMSKYKLLIL
jgi:hypothetical protein